MAFLDQKNVELMSAYLLKKLILNLMSKFPDSDFMKIYNVNGLEDDNPLRKAHKPSYTTIVFGDKIYSMELYYGNKQFSMPVFFKSNYEILLQVSGYFESLKKQCADCLINLNDMTCDIFVVDGEPRFVLKYKDMQSLPLKVVHNKLDKLPDKKITQYEKSVEK